MEARPHGEEIERCVPLRVAPRRLVEERDRRIVVRVDHRANGPREAIEGGQTDAPRRGGGLRAEEVPLLDSPHDVEAPVPALPCRRWPGVLRERSNAPAGSHNPLNDDDKELLGEILEVLGALRGDRVQRPLRLLEQGIEVTDGIPPKGAQLGGDLRPLPRRVRRDTRVEHRPETAIEGVERRERSREGVPRRRERRAAVGESERLDGPSLGDLYPARRPPLLWVLPLVVESLERKVPSWAVVHDLWRIDGHDGLTVHHRGDVAPRWRRPGDCDVGGVRAEHPLNPAGEELEETGDVLMDGGHARGGRGVVLRLLSVGVTAARSEQPRGVREKDREHGGPIGLDAHGGTEVRTLRPATRMSASGSRGLARKVTSLSNALAERVRSNTAGS